MRRCKHHFAYFACDCLHIVYTKYIIDMALFKTCVRTQRADKCYVVYIRVTHNRKIAYIKTDKVITPKGIRKGEVIDQVVVSDCAIKIRSYIDRLNLENTERLTVSEVVDLLTEKEERISFYEYSKLFIGKMINNGRERPSVNYRNSIRSLLTFYGKEDILFSDLNSKLINDWIYSLMSTNSAKNQYPKCIKTMFAAGCDEYNDYDRNIIKISNQPFRKVKIPSVTVPEKRSVSKDDILRFFNCDISDLNEREQFAKDVCMLSFCLVGMNTADLFDLDKSCLKENWLLCYNRKKTRDERGNGAYLQIEVPLSVRYLFEKYRGESKLFSFSERYKTPDNFNKYVDMSCKKIYQKEGIEKVTTYTFRHSWATIAQNICGASTEDVAFSLNHASAHKITEGYIKTDYTRIDKLNKKVLEYVFDTLEEKLK